MSDSVFGIYSDYYDLFYKDKNYFEESEYIKNLLSHNGIVNGDILEFGSGTGKHGILLSNYGYKVHGIELSAKMIAKAQKNKGFSCQQGDITSVNIKKDYDAVLALFHVISYQTTNKKLQMVFANAAKHLKTGGLFIFDFWFSSAVNKHVPSVRIKRFLDDKVEILRIAEPKIYNNENIVDVKFTFFVRNLKKEHIETFVEVHPMRHFSLSEFEILAAKNGFNCLQTEEFLTSKKVSENTWGVCMVLRKV
ncbi:SmtA SAM-dependent methyltransferases [Candidatus Pelagibacterales bacterium]